MPIYAMVAADLTKFISWGSVIVKRVWGYNNQATALYVQLQELLPLAAGGIPASSVTPFKSLTAPKADPGFTYDFGPDGLYMKQLVVAVSSTEINYTAVSANGGLELSIEVSGNCLTDGSEVVVGDLTTNQQTLQVWSEASGATAKKRLLRVDVQNNDNTNAGVLKVYATDAMAGADLVVSQIPVTKVGSGSVTSSFNAGVESLWMFQQDANDTQHQGCSLKVTGSTNCNIKALYK